jgi:hypothetical protein
MLAKATSLVLVLVLVLLLGIRAASAADIDSGQFVHEGIAAAGLTLDGLAVVTPDGLLALTNTTDQAKAHAFHPVPLHLRLPSSESAATTARSFSTCFVFAIVSPYDELSSHGLAFVVSPTSNLSTANAGQYLGLLNATNGTTAAVLAVELDTITDAEFHDINSNHVGVDVNSMISEQARPAGYYDDGDGGAFRELALNSRKPMQVWVDYDGRARRLDVTLAPVRVPKPKKPLLSMAIDLSTVVADPVYVGFSAATGVLSTHHYVLGWSFSLDGPAPPLDLSKLPVLPRLVQGPGRDAAAGHRTACRRGPSSRLRDRPAEAPVRRGAGRLGGRVRPAPVRVQGLVPCHQRVQRQELARCRGIRESIQRNTPVI